MKGRVILFLFAFFSHVCLPTNAFWDYGHVLVGEIARVQLNESVQQKLSALVGVDLAYFPDLFIPFTAVWPDYLKDSINIFDNWHYVDYPFVWGNATILVDNYSPQNIVSSLGYVLTTLTKNTSTAWSKGFAVRFLFHLVGDLHQPLHCSDFYDKNHTAGTLGGNLYSIQFGSINNLHSLFDSVGGLYQNRLPSPITQNFVANIRREAESIMKEFPLANFSYLESEAINITAWSLEGYKLSIDYGYQRIQQNSILTPESEYIIAVRNLLKRQIAVAGYRLARIIANADLEMYGPMPTPQACSSSSLTQREVFLISLICVMVLLFPISYIFGRRQERKNQGRENDGHRTRNSSTSSLETINASYKPVVDHSVDRIQTNL